MLEDTAVFPNLPCAPLISSHLSKLLFPYDLPVLVSGATDSVLQNVKFSPGAAL